MKSPDIRDMLTHQANWIEGLLPARDPRRTIGKLCSEVGELMEAVCLGPQEAIEDEFADCLVLLLDIAHLNNIDPVEAFYRKMAINENRDWKASGGCLQHTEINK